MHLPDGRVLSGIRGATVGAFLKLLQPEQDSLIVGAIVNEQLRELSYPLEMDVRVRPVCTSEADGMRFYRRSLTFLLETAFEELFHNANLAIDHSISSGGYFCQTFNRAALSENDLTALGFNQNIGEALDSRLIGENIPLNLPPAICLYKNLNLYEMDYNTPSEPPHEIFSQDSNMVDYIQFPCESLESKKGDSDDLALLYCALLESYGIKTALITVPGQMFMAISLDADLLDSQ